MFRINTLKKKLIMGVFIAFVCPYLISSMIIVEFVKEDVKKDFIKLSDQQIVFRQVKMQQNVMKKCSTLSLINLQFIH